MDKYAKHKKNRGNQHNNKECLRLNSSSPIREPYYEPPQCRGIRIYGDMNMGYLRLVYISLWNSGRIDSFYIRREKPENIGHRPKLNDDHKGWWLDGEGDKKKYGMVNLDKAIRGMMPGIRRFN